MSEISVYHHESQNNTFLYMNEAVFTMQCCMILSYVELT